MIFVDSRYADGWVYVANDARTGSYQNTVRRTFPTKTNRFHTYTWLAGDRIDQVSYLFLGDPAVWWKIMDINPEIVNPFSITPGTVLRIPNA
jgi:nucleoid-associated protein YgaU